MTRTMLKSKIHRATVSDCDLHYVGSLTVDPELLSAADILEHERRRQRRPLRDSQELEEYEPRVVHVEAGTNAIMAIDHEVATLFS